MNHAKISRYTVYPCIQELDGEALGKKPVPEDIHAEAMNIIRACLEGSGGAVQAEARKLQERFDALSQRIVEQRELCEEATAAMQEFHGPYDRFCLWLSAEEEKLEAVKRTRKEKPLGNIQCELEDFFVSSGGGGGGRARPLHTYRCTSCVYVHVHVYMNV